MKRKAGITFLVVVISFVSGTLILGSQPYSSDQSPPLNMPANDGSPCWSPDGSKIAFYSDRDGNLEIYTMDSDGSNQTRLINNPGDDWGPSWSPDGTMITFESHKDGNAEIYVMNADGSNQTRLTNNPADDTEPSWSPDGTRIAFCSDRDGDSEIYVMNVDGSNQTNLTNHPAVDGKLSWSPDGTQIAFSSVRDENPEIYVMHADGSNQTNLTNHPAGDGRPSWSPDGTQITFSSGRDESSEIYVMDADGSNQTNLTNNPAVDGRLSWSPDGLKIAFQSERDFCSEIYVMDADGSNLTNLTSNVPAVDTCSSVPLPQSELNLREIPYKIVFESYRETDGKENWEICLINADGSNLINLTNTPDIDEFYPHASPDGSMICFVADEGEDQESRSWNVYYMNIDGTGRTKVTENAYQPCWSHDGRYIAYLPGEYSRYNPNVLANKGLEIYDLETKRVKQHPNENLRNLHNLCWSPDGKWFVAGFPSPTYGSHAFKADDETDVVLSIGGCRPDISPDGNLLVWNRAFFDLDIGTLDFDSPEGNVSNHRVVVACELEYKVFHADWSPDGNYLAFSYGPFGGIEAVGRRAPGWNICICDLRTGKWTQITTGGKDYKEPDWVPVLSSTP